MPRRVPKRLAQAAKGELMKPTASRALTLAKSAARAVLRAHGHATAEAAELAGDRGAIALAAAAAQAHGPPAEEGGGDASGGSEGASGDEDEDDACELTSQIDALEVQRVEARDAAGGAAQGTMDAAPS
mmetsp:Transcript_21324/g.54074  ORF Transcript_21324/g.54074 Transcript_21324/m.54074 type:complete len:129 (-) Transcript_21324:246-632(-)